MKNKIIIAALFGSVLSWAQTGVTAPTQPTSPTTNSTSTSTGTPASTNVNNATTPGTTGELSNSALTTRIRQDLLNDPAFSSMSSGIRVEETNGTITLRGEVPSRTAEQDIINRVRQTSGVGVINNELVVTPAQNR